MEKNKLVNGAAELVTSAVLLAGSCGWLVIEDGCLLCVSSASCHYIFIMSRLMTNTVVQNSKHWADNVLHSW